MNGGDTDGKSDGDPVDAVAVADAARDAVGDTDCDEHADAPDDLESREVGDVLAVNDARGEWELEADSAPVVVERGDCDADVERNGDPEECVDIEGDGDPELLRELDTDAVAEDSNEGVAADDALRGDGEADNEDRDELDAVGDSRGVWDAEAELDADASGDKECVKSASLEALTLRDACGDTDGDIDACGDTDVHGDAERVPAAGEPDETPLPERHRECVPSGEGVIDGDELALKVVFGEDEAEGDTEEDTDRRGDRVVDAAGDEDGDGVEDTLSDGGTDWVGATDAVW